MRSEGGRGPICQLISAAIMHAFLEPFRYLTFKFPHESTAHRPSVYHVFCSVPLGASSFEFRSPDRELVCRILGSNAKVAFIHQPHLHRVLFRDGIHGRRDDASPLDRLPCDSPMTYPRQDLEADWSFGREGGARATDRPTDRGSISAPSIPLRIRTFLPCLA